MSRSKDPLRALLEASARQLEALAEQVEDLYDNAFVETNKSWVPPLLGAMVLAAIGIAYGRKRGRRRLPGQGG
jgi:hypothetical protein